MKNTRYISTFLILILLTFNPGNVSAYSITSFATTGTLPFGMTIDSAGNLYTANVTSNDVTKITPAGVSTTLASTGGTDSRGIAIDSSGNVYVANSSSTNLSKLTPGGVSSILGTTGTSPFGVVIDSLGNIYVSNLGSNDISKITPGGVSSIFASTGVGTNPAGITIDSSDNIYTANNLSNNVSKITSLGVVSILGTTGAGPVGIVLDSSGNVYTSNSDDATVTKITPGGLSTIHGTTGTLPRGITIDGAGNIYTANTTSANVTKITPGGVSTIIGTTGASPRPIVIDSSGNIYTANTTANTITKLTAPILTSVTPIGTTSDTTPDYTFNALTDTNTIAYGGSCSSATTVATLGNNTITLNALGDGTYSNCTIIVTDLFGPSNTLTIPAFTISTAISGGGGGGGGSAPLSDQCPDMPGFQESVVQCSTVVVTPAPVSTSTTGNTYLSPIDGSTQVCQPFTSYLKRVSTTNDKNQVKLWQAFFNKFEKEILVLDSIFGPKTESAVKRFQVKYSEQILKPWNITIPTGLIYKSTRAQANKLLGCSEGPVTLDNGVVVR